MQTQKIPSRVAALGFFDGVHLGHQAVLSLAAQRAKELEAISAAFTFEVSPKSFLAGSHGQISSEADLKRRAFELKAYGHADEVVFLPFNQRTSKMSYQAFITKVLIKKYHVCHLVMGENYTCGYKGQGDAATILAFCVHLGIGCDIVPSVKMFGECISSTRIKMLLACGDSALAEKLLGHTLESNGNVQDLTACAAASLLK